MCKVGVLTCEEMELLREAYPAWAEKQRTFSVKRRQKWNTTHDLTDSATELIRCDSVNPATFLDIDASNDVRPWYVDVIHL
jgi:hypothetical protein